MENKNHILSQLIKQKEIYKDIIITSIIIAIGVNILTEGILKFFNLEKYSFLLVTIGIILSLGVIVFYSYKKMKSINSSIEFEGFIMYDKLSNTILNIPRYDISGDMCKYLKGAFAENEKLKEIWDTQPISRIEENIEDENEIYIESKDIVIELLEYCILDRLSTELQDYFRKPNMNFEKLEKIERKNISQDLLSNRFINIFTEEIKNRKTFYNSKNEVEYNEKMEMSCFT